MTQRPADVELCTWLGAADQGGLNAERLRNIGALRPDGNLAPLNEWLTEAKKMGLDLKRLRKFGVLRADDSWVPVREWPELRRARLVQAYQNLRLRLGGSLLTANAGIEKMQ